MRVAQEEIFGPVLDRRSRSTTRPQALALANDVRYGLAGYLWTSDVGPRAPRRARDSTPAWSGSTRRTMRHLPTPFGGMKASGIGRDGGDYQLRLLHGDEERRAGNGRALHPEAESRLTGRARACWLPGCARPVTRRRRACLRLPGLVDCVCAIGCGRLAVCRSVSASISLPSTRRKCASGASAAIASIWKVGSSSSVTLLTLDDRLVLHEPLDAGSACSEREMFDVVAFEVVEVGPEEVRRASASRAS